MHICTSRGSHKCGEAEAAALIILVTVDGEVKKKHRSGQQASTATGSGEASFDRDSHGVELEERLPPLRQVRVHAEL